VNKTKILTEKRVVSSWVNSLLDEMSDALWFEPFSEGKWGTADVISHFITWDRFFLEHRIPYIQKGLPFPKIDINVEKINKDSSVYARSGIGKKELIQEYAETRGAVLSLLEEIPEEIFLNVMKVGKSELKVADYFYSHVQHDLKHKQQIVDFMVKIGNKTRKIIKN
jgi:hypothetical protein